MWLRGLGGKSGRWVCACRVSQWLKESDPGGSVEGEEGENSGTEENVTFQRDGRGFALGQEMLRLCFGSADPAAEPLLLMCCLVGMVEKCARDQKGVCWYSAAEFGSWRVFQVRLCPGSAVSISRVGIQPIPTSDLRVFSHLPLFLFSLFKIYGKFLQWLLPTSVA